MLTSACGPSSRRQGRSWHCGKCVLLLCAGCFGLLLEIPCIAGTVSPGLATRSIAVNLKPSGTPHIDTASRYFTEKGVRAYRKQRFSRAEKYFQEALSNAQTEGVKDSRLAMILANLACVKRALGKYDESEKLFLQALKVLEAQDHPSKGQLEYLAEQFAVLLRKTGRDAQADLIARNPEAVLSFLPAPRATTGEADKERIRSRSERSIASSPGGLFEPEPKPIEAAWEAELSLADRWSMLWDRAGMPDGGFLRQTPPAFENQPFPDSQVQTGPPPVNVVPADLDRSGNTADRLRPRIGIRITNFEAVPGTHVSWEALRAANDLLQKGNDVTVILDLEGVRVANRHRIDWCQVVRGSTGRWITHASLIRDFLQSGGSVVASRRWVKTFGEEQSLHPGIVLLNDDEMNEQLTRAGRVINY